MTFYADAGSEIMTYFCLQSNFLFKFLQFTRVQSDLHLWALDSNFDAIHVRVMDNACKDL